MLVPSDATEIPFLEQPQPHLSCEAILTYFLHWDQIQLFLFQVKQNSYLKMILIPLSDDSKWLICCRESNIASCGWKQHFFYWLLFRQYQAFDPMWPASAVKHSSSASLLVLSRITPESTSEILIFIIIKPLLWRTCHWLSLFSSKRPSLSDLAFIYRNSCAK